MRKVQHVKYLFIGVSCAALLAGCYHPDRSTRSGYYQSSYYSQGSGLTSRDTYSYTETEDQGATGNQTSQTTGTEIQSERMVIPLHEEQVQVGKRTVETGTIRLRKQITTETVNQPVEIRKETIVVDREPVGGTASSQSFQSTTGQGQSSHFQSQSGSIAQPFEQGEIVVRLHSEEPVIEKRIVPAGNIVVETRVNNEQVNVQQQIRREKIDVDKGNAQNVIVSENLTQQSGSSTQAQPQRYQQQTTAPRSSTTTRSSDVDSEYRAPVTTREYEPFPRPQPDGRETFPELKKDPERTR